MLLPSAWGFSPCPPVSVYGTGTYGAIAAFPGMGLLCFATLFRCASQPHFRQRVFLLPLRLLAPVFPFPAHNSPMRPHSSGHTQYRNFHLLSIGYASRPHLRPRLTQGRSALPWKPWTSGLEDSHLHLATHSGILSPRHSTVPSGTASLRRRCSPTKKKFPSSSRASAVCFSPGHFRRRTPRPVSYYALFKCMAASEPTSWLSSESHILFHLTHTWGP